jgi:hypothetical protein
MDLAPDLQPDPALEERVVSALAAAGLIRRRPSRRAVWLIAAAIIVLAASVSWWRARHAAAPGDTYVLLVYEDSTYRFAAPGHERERVAEMARWADSLQLRGQLDLGGRLVGSTAPGGLFIIRATSAAQAGRIAASCPHRKWGGRMELRRFIE